MIFAGTPGDRVPRRHQLPDSFVRADGRPNHDVAVQHFRAALKREVPIYLSAIVASEFQVEQAVTDLPLRNLIVLPFNIDHAMP